MPDTKRPNITSFARTARGWLGAAALAVAGALGACSYMPASFDVFSSNPPPPAQPAQPGAVIGGGQVKVALILPLSASGNAGRVAQSMRNAAEMALSEFNAPNIQLLVKDDAGTSQGAQQAAQAAMAEGAEIILGPLFAQAVAAAGQVARTRGVPVIAFSTDASVASRGVYLLSFMPESEVERIVSYAAGTGKRSFAALVPENAYGSVVEAAFQQTVAGKGARAVAIERYPDRARMQAAVQRVGQAAAQADALLVPDGNDAGPAATALTLGGINMRRIQMLGTSLWDDPEVFGTPSLQGGWFAAPDPAGFRSFAGRYRARFGQDPVRTATLAYDGVSLVAALVKTQGAQRFTDQILTTSSGFSGVDGIFRFRPNGTNERGLAVMRVGRSGGAVISPAPKQFSGSGT